VDLYWHKSRWFCAEPLRPRGSFTEQVREVSAGARLTCALRREAGRVVADDGRTVVQAGRDLASPGPPPKPPSNSMPSSSCLTSRP
jgi:hypothetical protein